MSGEPEILTHTMHDKARHPQLIGSLDAGCWTCEDISALRQTTVFQIEYHGAYSHSQLTSDKLPLRRHRLAIYRAHVDAGVQARST